MTPATRPRVIFRADGNATIGLGHVVRCLALAAMLQPDFDCVFAIQSPTAAMQEQIRQTGVEVWVLPLFADLTQDAAWLFKQTQLGDILVLDGYHFGPEYAYRFWSAAQPVVCLDDLLPRYLWADVVINHAGGIAPTAYSTVPGAQLCLGPAYALLRPAFQQASQQLRPPLNMGRIFLNMGGADPDNHTLLLLRQLRQRFPTKAIDVVTGAAYPHQQELLAQAWSMKKVALHHNISAEALAQILQACGIHVCPPSGMAYECCSIGGLLGLHPIAENQRHLLAYLTTAGLAWPSADLFNTEESRFSTLGHRMAECQRQVFDGAAGTRFRQVFRALHTAYQLTVRWAQATDARHYFIWANDPDVRVNAIHGESIAWESHCEWFTRRLADTDAFLYIFEQAGTPVGQVRIEFAGSEGTIDYSIDANYRGKGLGAAVLRRALGQLRREKPGAWALLGQVKSGNLPSCRVFQRLGFTQLPATRLHHETYEIFRLEAVSVDTP